MPEKQLDEDAELDAIIRDLQVRISDLNALLERLKRLKSVRTQKQQVQEEQIVPPIAVARPPITKGSFSIYAYWIFYTILANPRIFSSIDEATNYMEGLDMEKPIYGTASLRTDRDQSHWLFMKVTLHQMWEALQHMHNPDNRVKMSEDMQTLYTLIYPPDAQNNALAERVKTTLRAWDAIP